MSSFYFLPRGRRHPSPRVKHLLWRLEAVLIGGGLSVFRCLPPRLSAWFAGRLCARFGVFMPRASKARANLGVAFPQAEPEHIRRLTRATFAHLGVAMSELARLDRIWRDHARRIEFVIKPGAAIPDPARRTVFVTAHLGAWQLTPLIGPYYGLDIPIIYAPEKNPYVDRRLAQLRAAFGARLVPRNGGLRVLMRALEAGQSIGLTVDTRLDSGEDLPFFGEDAPTNTAPARLALRYHCDLVPVRAERLPGARYRVSIHPPIAPRNTQAADSARARDMTAQLNALFEDWIRATPGQWLCLKRRWPKPVHARFAARTRGNMTK